MSYEDDIEIKKPGPVSYVGIGCGCLGLLLTICGIAVLVMVGTGVFNYSVETPAGVGGGAGTCLGLVGLAAGLAMYFLGKKKVEDE